MTGQRPGPAPGDEPVIDGPDGLSGAPVTPDDLSSLTGMMDATGPASVGPGIAELPDDEVEQLLMGTGLDPDPAWQDVARFLGQIRSESTVAPGDAWVRQYVAAAAASVRNDVVVPVPTAGRRRHRLRMGAAVAATTLVGSMGLAAAGTLPAPLQNAAARVAEVVGVELPHSGGDGPPTPTTVPSTEAPPGSAPGAGEGRPTEPGRADEAPGQQADSRPDGGRPEDPGASGQSPGGGRPEDPGRPAEPGKPDRGPPQNPGRPADPGPLAGKGNGGADGGGGKPADSPSNTAPSTPPAGGGGAPGNGAGGQGRGQGQTDGNGQAGGGQGNNAGTPGATPPGATAPGRGGRS